MKTYKEGYYLAKTQSHRFSTISEVKKHYTSASEDFIRGFIDGFDEYWTDKLMGEF